MSTISGSCALNELGLWQKMLVFSAAAGGVREGGQQPTGIRSRHAKRAGNILASQQQLAAAGRPTSAQPSFDSESTDGPAEGPSATHAAGTCDASPESRDHPGDFQALPFNFTGNDELLTDGEGNIEGGVFCRTFGRRAVDKKDLVKRGTGPCGLGCLLARGRGFISRDH